MFILWLLVIFNIVKCNYQDGSEVSNPDEDKIESKYSKAYIKKARTAFIGMRAQYEKMGITEGNVNARYKHFLKNYKNFLDIEKKSGSFKVELNSLELLDDKELHQIFNIQTTEKNNDIHRKLINENTEDKGDGEAPPSDRVKPHSRIMYQAGDSTSLIGHLLEYHDRDVQVMEECANLKLSDSVVCEDDMKAPCKPASDKRRCVNSTVGIPDEFRDWETLSYVDKLIAFRDSTVMAGGWATVATQTIDMYQQIYGRNVTSLHHDLIDFKTILNCVYKDNPLSRGSPQAAYEFMKKKVVLPKQYWFPEPTQSDLNNYYEHFMYDNFIENTWYKYEFLWTDSVKGRENEFCEQKPEWFNPGKNHSTPDVMFMKGKAYIHFSDTNPVEVWQNSFKKTIVRGEEVVKPLLYKKGPVNAMMAACYEMFFMASGIFDYDCSVSERNYLPQWVTIVSYGPHWFGVVLPIYTGEFVTQITKVSRVREYTMNWDSFVIPRVDRYTDPIGCSKQGLATSQYDNQCFCKIGYYGKKCRRKCNIHTNCLNGGVPSHYGCKCDCPKSHYGRQCGKKCLCGEHGTCDEHGNCVCHRQSVYGDRCQHTCKCLNGGYCHNDGTCECINGFGGDRCTEPCSKSCVAPKVCRFRALQVEVKAAEPNKIAKPYCECPFGLYGEKCDKLVNCKEPDAGDSLLCQRYKDRHRCFEEDAMEKCPQSCGHCLYLNVATDLDN